MSSSAPEAETEPPLAGWRARLLDWREKLGRLLLIPQLSLQESRSLRQRIIAGARLDKGYALMCALSAGIAILGLLQSSTAVVIGAMLVSPLMGPIAALGISFASLDGKRIRQAANTIAAGSAIGIGTGMVITWISPISDATAEILARTQPNLLDLAVALLSGLAGGYATIMARGETAIGVAIATALMPPLATVGYGLGTLNMAYTLGALLLFLTNLSAIAFAFALVARLSGAARRASQVEWSGRHTAILVIAFLILAVPLALTMTQVKRELSLRSDARAAIVAAFGPGQLNIAQLEAKWSMFNEPQVRAVTISDHYVADLEQGLRAKLLPVAGDGLALDLQQVLASSSGNQARAAADAAVQRGFAQFVASGPPIEDVRASLGIPVRSFASDRGKQVIYVEPFAADEWQLADFEALEQRVAGRFGEWTIQLVPPLQQTLTVDTGAQGDSLRTALWAMERWATRRVEVDVAPGDDPSAIERTLAQAGITMTATPDRRLAPGRAAIHVIAAPERPPAADEGRNRDDPAT